MNSSAPITSRFTPNFLPWNSPPYFLVKAPSIRADRPKNISSSAKPVNNMKNTALSSSITPSGLKRYIFSMPTNRLRSSVKGELYKTALWILKKTTAPSTSAAPTAIAILTTGGQVMVHTS